MKTRMKKILAAATFVLGFGMAMASGTHEEMKLPDYTPLKKEIRKQIPFPEFAKRPNMNENVLVSFTVANDGSLLLVSVSGDDAPLKKYVSETLKTMKVDRRYANEEIYKANINFKVL